MTIHKWQMTNSVSLAGLAVATIRPDLRISNGGKYVTVFMNTGTKDFAGGLRVPGAPLLPAAGSPDLLRESLE